MTETVASTHCAWLSRPGWFGWIPSTHPSSKQCPARATTLIETNALLLSQADLAEQEIWALTYGSRNGCHSAEPYTGWRPQLRALLTVLQLQNMSFWFLRSLGLLFRQSPSDEYHYRCCPHKFSLSLRYTDMFYFNNNNKPTISNAP